jgi:SAM-dependent methyltransferase
MLNKYLIVPIVSKSVGVRYNQYLCDKTTANEFASNYLPEALHNGSSREAFDIGCGRGRHVAMLNQLGYSVTGLDLQSHPYWTRIPQASFMVGTTDCLSFIPEEVFDLVICVQVLMYLVYDGTALAHIRRILKRGGTLLLQVTNAENLHTVITKQSLAEDPYLQRYYKQSELCNKLAQHNFIIDRIWTEKFYTPFFVLPGNILYEFILSQPLKRFWDKLVPPRHLGLINILAHPA